MRVQIIVVEIRMMLEEGYYLVDPLRRDREPNDFNHGRRTSVGPSERILECDSSWRRTRDRGEGSHW
jgi:hypothetical protein